MNAPKPDLSTVPESRWPHWLAWVLACATFPLVWMGGLVTTYEAGMAVPDWPTTYGHWFYPLQRWLWSFTDLFLEHGHRTIAQAVGLITIALAVAIWRTDLRRVMRWLAVAAVVGVILQGTLGGLRVIFDKRLLAKIHGCTAPLFFALCAVLVVMTSTAWRQSKPAEHAAATTLRRLSATTAAGVYLLIVLGAQLRHLAPDAWHGWFTIWVWAKLIAVAAVTILVVLLVRAVLKSARDRRRIVRRTWWLAGLFSVQLVLGAGAWVTNYGWPAWFRNYVWNIDYTIAAEGPLQVWTTTGHAAVGSLVLVASIAVCLWTYGLLRPAGR